MSGNLIDLANDILRNADIVEVISHYIKVEKKGRNYTGLCPFHDDKSLGNFYISKEKGIFKCFSCNAGGNAINFVQKIENLSYKDAVLKTAELIGYQDTRLLNYQTTVKINPEIKAIQDCLTEINNFYQNSLFFSEDGKDALDYLHHRGLTDDVIRFFKIGYAQSKGENIIEYLKSKNFSIKTIAETGIIHLETTPYRDLNANRITFAITDRNNQIVGFSCRKFKDGNTSSAKYVNTSSTKLFNKGNLLYNYYNALNEAKKSGYVYLLEGFMDVIACHRVGIRAAVGLMGTALSKDNLQSLRYFNCEVRLCLDLDGPGQLNMKKISDIFDESNIKYRLVSNEVDFPEKDTDEILKKYGEDKLKSYLANLVNKGEWLIKYFKKSLNLSTLEGKKQIVNNLIPYLSTLKDELEIDYFINELSTLSGYSYQTIQQALRRYNKKLNKKDEEALNVLIKSNKSEAQIVLNRLQLAEKQVLRYMLENKDVIEKYDIKLGYFSTPIYREIANVIEEYVTHIRINTDYNIKNLMTYLSSEDFEARNKDKIMAEITDIAVDDFKVPPYSKEQFDDLIQTINKERVENQTLDVYKNSSLNKTEIEKAEYAKTCLAKLKSLIEEEDKKRRN